jgi:nitrate/TMAO reductase-like tetraheme cytochrome c subunit
MPTPFAPALAATIVAVIGLVALVASRPSIIRAAGGRMTAVFAMFLLPGLVLALGTVRHVEESKSTTFCLSCHVMEPYGRSLHIADSAHLPASHFQNKRIPRDEACFTCHTHYTMFGDLRAKLGGLRHMWVYYTGTTPDRIELYQPYQNRECLHCHGTARSFEEEESHVGIREELTSNAMSCLDCHDQSHDVQHVDELDVWKPEKSA